MTYSDSVRCTIAVRRFIGYMVLFEAISPLMVFRNLISLLFLEACSRITSKVAMWGLRYPTTCFFECYYVWTRICHAVADFVVAVTTAAIVFLVVVAVLECVARNNVSAFLRIGNAIRIYASHADVVSLYSRFSSIFFSLGFPISLPQGRIRAGSYPWSAY